MQKKLANKSYRRYIMLNNEKSQKSAESMILPRSVLFHSLKEAIETKDENRIGELTDILHNNMQYHLMHAAGISDNSAKIDFQNQNISNILETMKEGFKQTDLRFRDLIQQMNKRFEQVDKRFDDLIHQMDKKHENLIHQIDKRFEDMTHLMDKRHEELTHTIEKRHEDLMHQTDKRFTQNEKTFSTLIDMTQSRFNSLDSRFRMQTWFIGIGFIAINTMVVVLKIFS